MSGPYKAVRVSEKVYWVGAVDWTLRHLHGYSTPRGTTYNAYLVLAQEVALIDTVKAPFKEELLSRVASVIEPEKIDYIVSNHSEMDHSGCLPEVVEIVKPKKVLASARGVATLAAHFHRDWEVQGVKDGETFSLGDMNLLFIHSPMLHWPESMCTYLREEAVLFSQDAFGMHLASSERFADEMDASVLEYEGAKYFANILLPYAGRISGLVEKMAGAGIAPKIIAPDHGPIWRKDVQKIIEWYGRWAAQRPSMKAVVVYDTMWQSTAKMARAMMEGLLAGGANPVLHDLGASQRADVVTDILGAGALFVGSPTINNGVFPTVADFLTYLKGLKPQNLMGAAFGSYGWSGEAAGQIMEALQAMGVQTVGEGIKVKYVPDETALAECHSLGKTVAEQLGERLKAGEWAGAARPAGGA